MPKTKKSHKPASSALLKWENAGKKLATALSAYLQSCASLETLSTTQSIDYSDMPNRIQISLETLHPKLFDELSQSQVILARMNNKMSSRFNSLPNEILAEIFLDVVYNPGPDEARFPEMVDSIRRILGRLHCLLAVCSTWRNVAMELGDLWSLIPVTDNPLTHPTLEASSLAVQRSQARASGKHHLHLAAVLWDRHYDPDQLFKNNSFPPFSTINIEARSKCATISVYELLRKLLGSQSPLNVSEMSIHHYKDLGVMTLPRLPEYCDHLDLLMPRHERNAFRTLIESLSVLRLKNVNIRWNAIAFSGQLVELHLESVMLGERFAMEEFPRVLQSTPELRTLKLISVVPLHPNWEHPGFKPVALPKLQLFLLVDLYFNGLNYLIDSVARGSHSTKVTLTHKAWRTLRSRGGPDWDTESDESPHAGWDVVQQSNNDVCYLLESSDIDTLILEQHFRNVDEPNKTLRMLLRSLPRLSSLIIVGWDLNSQVFRALERPLSNEPFPYLAEIFILDSVIEDPEHLLDVVASHSLQTLVVDSPYSLLSEDGGGEDIIQDLGRVVPDFRFVESSEQIDELNHSWRLW